MISRWAMHNCQKKDKRNRTASPIINCGVVRTSQKKWKTLQVNILVLQCEGGSNRKATNRLWCCQVPFRECFAQNLVPTSPSYTRGLFKRISSVTITNLRNHGVHRLESSIEKVHKDSPEHSAQSTGVIRKQFQFLSTHNDLFALFSTRWSHNQSGEFVCLNGEFRKF